MRPAAGSCRLFPCYEVASAVDTVRTSPPEYGRDHILFHARLTDEDRRRCADEGYGRGWIYPQVGAAVDWSVGDRFFIRADARLILLRVGIGAGFRF